MAVELELVAADHHLDAALRILDPLISSRMPEEQRQQQLRLDPVTQDRWLAAMPGAEEPVPAFFYESHGRRYLHLGGRAMLAVDS